MNTERIKEIQQETAYPESVSVQQALLKVWNECEQEQLRIGAVSGLLCPRCKSSKILEADKENDNQCKECNFVWA